MSAVDLRAVLSAFLIPAGTYGRREVEIFKRFRHLEREDVLTELQVMWEEKLVQRFTVNKKHVWRATEELNY